ncbi:MAG TPA: protein kinase [Terriglobia bacterium]|nr:protein kinase [Terriglobia bacterium]
MAEALTKAGRYQIVSELGRGSMGVVYEGFDPIIGRTVAIKTMLPEGLSPQEFEEYKARFQREATAAGKLAHPNIITVYDFGEDNGILYLAMEYLEGKSLEKIVQEQTVLPIETILPIYDQICSALDHAHRNKVVHRDIKPANIMILRNGLVKVTDFGIAKMMDMGMTQVGQILGTPNYMSPEQVKGRQIDGRSDIFSMGVILYELVTGEKPFGGQNITTVIYKIINENPIPPRELDASIHAGLSYVISKALAKNPDERYQTCKELADDLRNYKNLGSTATGQSTVILMAAPVRMEVAEPAPALAAQVPPPESAPSAVDEAPTEGSLDIPMISPPAPHRQSIPQIAWVLGALLVVAIMGVVSYFVMLRPESHEKVSSPVVKIAPSQNPQASVTPAPQPGTPATVTTAQPTTTNPAEASPKGHDLRTQPAAAKVGQLKVSANVTGARISIDGQSDSNWLTPFTVPNLTAGTHNIVISMDGYENSVQSVTIEGGKTAKVVGNLSAPTAELDIVTVPPGVEVLIDGKPRGPSPVTAVLAPGNHTYAVKQPGVEPIPKVYNLKSGIHMITVTLGVAATTGIVEVRTIPAGASVQADGALIGGQTPTNFRLSVGPHTLTISLSGCRPMQRQITVAEKDNPAVQVFLTCP